MLILYAIIVGFIGGAAVSAGAARMYHIPQTQAMGAFRTLGELNACQGDKISHFSFGFGFLLNSAAAAVSTGALTQDVLHRVIPNFSAGILLFKNKSVEETLHNPYKMFIVGGFVGAIVMAFLVSLSRLVPTEVALIAKEILTPAANLMINPVMPIVFLLAALDAGKITGTWAVILGGLAHIIMGNGTPGIILGILIGQSIQDNKGLNKTTVIMIGISVILLVSIAYFRGIFSKIGF
ncbi:MAG: DUF4311 domain-containing protein [Alphaproteobacteria bacterium]|jgi:uncharacterized protein (TIGR03580 family)|nr:DUF4311 domain-containing protein [Alphaproteobacteria bacterium]